MGPRSARGMIRGLMCLSSGHNLLDKRTKVGQYPRRSREAPPPFGNMAADADRSHALCSNPQCRRVFRWQNRLPPKLCLHCGFPMVRWCPTCGASFEKLPTEKDPYCLFCGLDVLHLSFNPELYGYGKKQMPLTIMERVLQDGGKMWRGRCKDGARPRPVPIPWAELPRTDCFPSFTHRISKPAGDT